MRVLLPAIAGALLLLGGAVAAEPLADCAAALPGGLPQGPGLGRTLAVCHQHGSGGYAAFVDPALKVPALVAYRLDRPHTLGCLKRPSGFHAEADLPPAARAVPADYKGSGYDLGHMAPNEDFAWDPAAQHDSFSLANIAPQLPGLNRQQWERLEETARAWAWMRGSVAIYVGPQFLAGLPTAGIGGDAGRGPVAVPTGFWKVLADPKSGEAIGFAMPQQTIPKGDLAPWRAPVAAIAALAGLAFPVPAVDQGPLWPADLAGYRLARKTACGGE